MTQQHGHGQCQATQGIAQAAVVVSDTCEQIPNPFSSGWHLPKQKPPPHRCVVELANKLVKVDAFIEKVFSWG